MDVGEKEEVIEVLQSLLSSPASPLPTPPSVGDPTQRSSQERALCLEAAIG